MSVVMQTFEIVTAIMNPSYSITPKVGQSLIDVFNLTVSIDYPNSKNLVFQHYIYFFVDQLFSDINSFSIDYGYQITDWMTSTTFQTQLPAGTVNGNLYLLVCVMDSTTCIHDLLW